MTQLRDYGRQIESDPLLAATPPGTVQVGTRPPRPRLGRGLAWAVAAFVVVLAVGGLYFAFSGDDGQVVDQTTVPTPTTVPAPEPETMTDLEVIEAGVAAFYSGDGERAAALFELPDRTDEQVRQESAFQAAIGGQLTLNCDPDGPGQFQCFVPYQNAPADAIGYRDSPGDNIRVVVENGQVTQFLFPWHTWLERDLSGFLSEVENGQVCGQGGFGHPLLRTTDCANWIMEHLDEWIEWYQS